MTQGSSDLALPAKRKRTLASKLTSEENAYTDMFKKRKGPESFVNPLNLPRQDRRASVEIMDDTDDIQQYPSGQPKNAAAIIEAANGSDDDDLPKMVGKSKRTAKPTTSRQDRRASVEIMDDADNIQQYPSGQPKNPAAIIEAADGSDDDDLPKMVGKSKRTSKPTTSRQNRCASVEIIDDDEENHRYPSGQPRNPTAIIEAADGSDDNDLSKLGRNEETATEELGEYQKKFSLLFDWLMS